MANKYSDIVRLREQKAAYNIQNEQDGDWNTFLTNEHFNDILRKVISSVRNNDADMHKSFWIAGTYGTGKSHAGSVIKHLLCDPIENIKDYVNDQYSETKHQILKNDILQLREHRRLFPIMLYGMNSIAHRDDLSLELQRAIQNAFQKANINICVQTDFDNYIDHIQNNKRFWEDLIEGNAQLRAITPTYEKLVSDLKQGDTGTLVKVREALRERKFDIRLDNTNLAQWFFQIQNKLAETTEYDGLLVIWDEFTDVMTSTLGSSLLVMLQEIDERVMNSDNNSYFLYISHPSALDGYNAEEREKTRGRYHYMHYNMEPISAFKILSSKFQAVDRTALAELQGKFYAGNSELLMRYAVSSSNATETMQDIVKLFPLHPSTANLAAYYAREAGSSSRSVFQFIGENSDIRQFLDNEEYFDCSDTITADFLWDYVVEEFNNNVAKYGAVTERYNSRHLQVENKGEGYLKIFKGVLLLNALNNLANNATVTPSMENIQNLFAGTRFYWEVDEALDFFDTNSIIQRLPGDLFSIQFSALPTQEIEDIKKQLLTNLFKYTSNIVNFSDVTQKEMGKKLNLARPYSFKCYSTDLNEYVLLNKIENDYKNSRPYELFLALFFAKNNDELYSLKTFAEKCAKDERFENVVFIVFQSTMTDKRYDRFIEYQANATCANKHSLTEQYDAHIKSATDILKEWLNEVGSGNYDLFLRDSSMIGAVAKITTLINNSVSPVIFSYGPESLETIRIKFSKTYWNKVSARVAVDSVLSYQTKSEIVNKCVGPAAHVNFLLQDSVDENLQYKPDVENNHPLYLVQKFIDSKFSHTDKSQSFNMGEKLSDLQKPPFGLYQSYAGMSMVAFAMRKYVKQIFDTNGKPLTEQHLVDDVVDMFKAWESDRINHKLERRFETKESRNLCDSLIKTFQLNKLKGYSDITSLTDARWAITHSLSESKGYPLWSLKYVTKKEGLQKLIDNVLKICNESDLRNPVLINDALGGMQTYTFELSNLLNNEDSFKIGFRNYLQSIEIANIKDEEIEDVEAYLKQNLEQTVGLWSEQEVVDKAKDWRLTQNSIQQSAGNHWSDSETIPEVGNTPKITVVGNIDEYQEIQRKASAKLSSMSDSQAKKVLKYVFEKSSIEVWNLINEYDD